MAAWDTYNWTGAYVGGFAGRTVGEEQWRYINFGTTVQPEFGGHIFGGQAGYNVQLGRIVVGVEGDYGFSNANGGKSCPNGFFFTCEAEADRLASLTGRLGFTWGRALFYAKGGWAAGEITARGFQNTGGQPIFQGVPNPPNLATGASTSNWVTGWILGGGMEFALTDRWSAKAEYMHFELEKDRYLTDNSGGGGGLVDASARGDTVRVGVNYHFNTMREPGPLK